MNLTSFWRHYQHAKIMSKQKSIMHICCSKFGKCYLKQTVRHFAGNFRGLAQSQVFGVCIDTYKTMLVLCGFSVKRFGKPLNLYSWNISGEFLWQWVCLETQLHKVLWMYFHVHQTHPCKTKDLGFTELQYFYLFFSLAVLVS